MLSNIYFWLRFIFAYQKSLKRTLKTGFWVQNHLFNLSSSAVNSQRLFKKLVWMFVLMLSGIQIGFPFSLFLIKTVSFSTSHKNPETTEFSFFLSSTFNYELILIKKKSPLMLTLWRGKFFIKWIWSQRSQKVILNFKIIFVCDILFV